MAFGDIFARYLRLGTTGATRVRTGTGSPEASVTGAIGDVYIQTDGSFGSSFWVKESGTGNTGWANVGGGIRSKSTTLTDAQIKANPTTAIALTGSLASGFSNKLIAARLIAKFTAGAYTNINATYAACAIHYLGDFTQWAAVPIVNDSGGTGANKFTGVFGNATNEVVDLSPYVDTPTSGTTGWVLPNNQAYASVNGAALAIKMDNNGSGNLTGGNSANTLTVQLLYAPMVLP